MDARNALGIVSCLAMTVACQKGPPEPGAATSESPSARSEDAAAIPFHGPDGFNKPDGWVAFDGPDGLYTVLFPGTPTTRESSETTGGNVEVTKLALYEAHGGRNVYVAAVSEVAIPGLFDLRAGVRGVVKNAVSGVGGTIATVRELAWGAAAGREVTFDATVEGTRITGLVRAYILAGEKTRYWRVMAMNVGASLDGPSRAFVESFTLGIPKEAAPPKRVARVLERSDGTVSVAQPPREGAKHVPVTPSADEGVGLAPIITGNITFVAPKAGASWFEVAFPCLRAGIGLEAGGTVAAAMYKASPLIEPAMKAAGIDPDRDIAALGYWEKGDARAVYLAVTLRAPAAIGGVMAGIPNAKSKLLAPLAWSLTLRCDAGPRTIHVRALPLTWGDSVPDDAWSHEAAAATHLVAISFGGPAAGAKAPADPLTALETGPDAEARVRYVEGLLPAPYGRCVIGAMGPGAFKPGFALTDGRFVFALPAGKNDPFTQMLGSNRTVDLGVEFALVPAPAQADLDGWVAETEAMLATTVAGVRAQFESVPGAGAYLDRYMELFGSLGKIGLKTTLVGKVVTVSWRSDRITAADADAFEAKAEALEAAPPSP